MIVKLEIAEKTTRDRYLKEISAAFSSYGIRNTIDWKINWENEKYCLNKSSKASVTTGFRAFVAAFLKGCFLI